VTLNLLVEFTILTERITKRGHVKLFLVSRTSSRSTEQAFPKFSARDSSHDIAHDVRNKLHERKLH